jgi:hypothetical protein
MREIRQNPRDVSVGCPDFSPATIGARYAKRLNEIWEGFATSGEKQDKEAFERVIIGHESCTGII